LRQGKLSPSGITSKWIENDLDLDSRNPTQPSEAPPAAGYGIGSLVNRGPVTLDPTGRGRESMTFHNQKKRAKLLGELVEKLPDGVIEQLTDNWQSKPRR
jgi:hypothetical protein